MEIKNLLSGRFLKTSQIKENIDDAFVITNEGRTEFSQRYQKDQLILGGQWKGEDREWTCNATNMRVIAEKHESTDTKNWIGAMIYFQIEKKTIKGELTDVLGIRKIILNPEYNKPKVETQKVSS